MTSVGNTAARMVAATVAALSVATLGGTVAQAAPSPDPASIAPELRGTSEQIGYHVATSDDQRSVVTDLVAGSFRLVDDGNIVTITDRDDNIVAALPMVVRIADKRVPLTPAVSENGTRLTIAPTTVADEPVRKISNADRLLAEMNKHQPQVATGAAIGAAIGFVLGFPLGGFVLDFITIPIAMVVGGVIGAFGGLYAGGGEESLQVAREYFAAPLN